MPYNISRNFKTKDLRGTLSLDEFVAAFCFTAQKESRPNSIFDWRTGKREITHAFSYPGWKSDDLLKVCCIFRASF